MIFFKAEETSKIGGGHLYRSLTIARECTKAGEICEFIFAESPDSSIQKVIDAGYKTHNIDETKQFNSEVYLKIIPKKSLVVFDTDDYRFYSGELIDSFREEKIQTACFSITDQYLITTDLLINPNIISKLHTYKTASATKKLLGPEYFVMSENFREHMINRGDKKINSPSTMLLIFGNADICNLTIYFLPIISMLSGLINNVIVVVGKLNPDLEKIREQVSLINGIDVELHIDTKEIDNLYKRCDIAITSAGMAMWEMSLFLIPQFVIASTPRELEYTDYLSKLGYIKKLGDFSSLPNNTKMGEKLKDIFQQKQFGNIKTAEFSELINPNGIQLIVENFISLLLK